MKGGEVGGGGRQDYDPYLLHSCNFFFFFFFKSSLLSAAAAHVRCYTFCSVPAPAEAVVPPGTKKQAGGEYESPGAPRARYGITTLLMRVLSFFDKDTPWSTHLDFFFQRTFFNGACGGLEKKFGRNTTRWRLKFFVEVY